VPDNNLAHARAQGWPAALPSACGDFLTIGLLYRETADGSRCDRESQFFDYGPPYQEVAMVILVLTSAAVLIGIAQLVVSIVSLRRNK
jgi:hypothetical protein